LHALSCNDEAQHAVATLPADKLDLNAAALAQCCMYLRGAALQHHCVAMSITAVHQEGDLVIARLARPLSYVDETLLGSLRASGKPLSYAWRCRSRMQAFRCRCLASASMRSMDADRLSMLGLVQCDVLWGRSGTCSSCMTRMAGSCHRV
jgi:hypothetical protein